MMQITVFFGQPNHLFMLSLLGPPFLHFLLFPLSHLPALLVAQILFQHSACHTNKPLGQFPLPSLLCRTIPLDGQNPPFSINMPPFPSFPTTRSPNYHAHNMNYPQARIYGPYNQIPLSGRRHSSPTAIPSYYLLAPIFLIHLFSNPAIYLQILQIPPIQLQSLG